MNIILDLNRLVIGNTHFLDTKRNIIIEGDFTKIIYSSELFTMNGIYLLFPIEISTIDKITNKTIMKFHPYSRHNLSSIQDFSKLEYQIIEYYKQMHNCTKKTSNMLSKQMYTGSMKLYKGFLQDQYMYNYDDVKSIHCVIKISGIWETFDEVGLTFKLFYANE